MILLIKLLYGIEIFLSWIDSLYTTTIIMFKLEKEFITTLDEEKLTTPSTLYTGNVIGHGNYRYWHPHIHDSSSIQLDEDLKSVGSVTSLESIVIDHDDFVPGVSNTW